MSTLQLAKSVRLRALDLIYAAQTSHIGSNFSCADILAVLYSFANVDKDLKTDRDRIVLSKGWAAAAVYAVLEHKGILSRQTVDTFGKPGGLLGLVEHSTRGIEASTGSMGHGLPIGIGMALAAVRDGAAWHTYVLMSDGEMDCGTTWESALIAATNKLKNLTVIVDVNGWQAMGRTKDVLDTASLTKKWQAFNWNVIRIDGHDHSQIKRALKQKSNGPKVILAQTVKGKGVSFMEDKLEWHYKAPNREEYQLACEQLS